MRLMLAAIAVFERFGGGRVDTHCVRGQESAVSTHQSQRAWIGAQALDHFGQRMHRVVVARPTEEWQPTGQCQATRVIGFQMQGVDGAEDRNREAAVDVKVTDLINTDTRLLQSLLIGQGHGRRAAQILALEH
ncbi:hypothetical protein D9M71_737700 [compost metagenome]